MALYLSYVVARDSVIKQLGSFPTVWWSDCAVIVERKTTNPYFSRRHRYTIFTGWETSVLINSVTLEYSNHVLGKIEAYSKIMLHLWQATGIGIWCYVKICNSNREDYIEKLRAIVNVLDKWRR